MVLVGIIALVILAILALASARPDSFRVERSATINAPADRIFPHLDDFHKWEAWSPWEKLDPNLQRTHSGAPSGKGAIYEWRGDPKVGEGRMEILESVPSSRILIKLDFIKPFAASNRTEFTFVPEGSGTRLVWAMTGVQAFGMKVMGLFMSMDSMVGKDFEKGLASLKALCEG